MDFGEHFEQVVDDHVAFDETSIHALVDRLLGYVELVDRVVGSDETASFFFRKHEFNYMRRKIIKKLMLIRKLKVIISYSTS